MCLPSQILFYRFLSVIDSSLSYHRCRYPSHHISFFLTDHSFFLPTVPSWPRHPSLQSITNFRLYLTFLIVLPRPSLQLPEYFSSSSSFFIRFLLPRFFPASSTLTISFLTRSLLTTFHTLFRHLSSFYIIVANFFFFYF